ncbi:hypothetical protein HMI54_004057 [Coelomomyces lativittatus]|nr:hypothetical protein HMI54_004057 [Coelomomyces lativittatus]KAJ1517032.1 hypothetical protein HMI55_000813 [Coelomomyces lativittatus]
MLSSLQTQPLSLERKTVSHLNLEKTKMNFSQLLSPPLTPNENCLHESYVSSSSPVCNNCQRTISPLYDLYSERVDLLNKMEDLASKLKQKEKETQRYLEKARRNKSYTEELEDRYDAMADENEQLKLNLTAMSERMKTLEETSEILKKESAAKDAEVEDLTRALFEEANGMVAKETQLRYASETTEKQLQKQLAESQARLAMHEARQDDMKGRNRSMSSTPEIDPMMLLPLLDFVTMAPSTPIEQMMKLEFVNSMNTSEFQPCLTFSKSPELNLESLYLSILRNQLSIEPKASGKECEFCEKEAQYELKEGPKEWQKNMCKYCRDRIIVVCDYLGFLKNIRAGLYSGQNILVIWLGRITF